MPMAPEESVSCYVPSEAAPGHGLAVNVIYPQTTRYKKDGAPVVVVVPGGEGGSGLRTAMHAVQVGFVEVRFAFPGGGLKQFHSGGSWDERGKDSQKALRDVLLFARGEKADTRGKTISELVPVPVDVSNIGAVGWDNGGNILLVTMAKFPLDLGFIKWIAFYESPIGSLTMPSCLGTTGDLLINSHYRQGSAATGTCLIDFRKLAWQPGVFRNRAESTKLARQPASGVLFFDENGNKIWEESQEFPISYACAPGSDKHYYAPEVLKAAKRLKLFADEYWPPEVATLQESESFFQERDGSLYIKQIPLQYPDLLITVFGSRLDHEQRQPDHPHIALQYNAWLAAKPRWLRLNPDPKYVGQLSDMNPLNFVDNPPNSSIDASAIDSHLEVEGLIGDQTYMQATIAELADRVRTDNLKSPLAGVIVDYENQAIKEYKKDLLFRRALGGAKKPE